MQIRDLEDSDNSAYNLLNALDSSGSTIPLEEVGMQKLLISSGVAISGLTEVRSLIKYYSGVHTSKLEDEEESQEGLFI